MPPLRADAADASLVLQAHEQRPWQLPRDLERVAIADPGVADLVMLKGRREALLTAKQPGQTTLLLWHRGQPEPQRLVVQVRSALQAQLQDDAGAQVSVHDGAALLQGSADSTLDHERARLAAAATVGDKGMLADASTVAGGGVVQVDVKVVEFDRTLLRQLGLKFNNANGGFSYGITSPNGATGGGDSVGNALSSAFNLVAGSTTGKWSGSLNLLQSNGMARVLAEPTLVALSGQSASFLAGGELPIPEPQGLGTTTITYKSFGIGLTVTPTVLAPDRIALKVAPEASDLDYTNGVTLSGTKVPGIITRRADTTIELGDGETFVIGGLISQNLRSQVNKIPLLGDIPIIGVFFRDLDFRQEDKELVIVVTPHLIKPFARGTTLPLPGQREAQRHLPVWGAFLLDPAGSDQLPGFSR
ncbi:type II and III secretion system protein family protein [Frateuria sp. Soil773]|uniref:type II and III secretion system protein family protein n=1 Tax=Frateuria sp. Soil773 TaxID=1736407 RepID=UPI001F16C818|nr:type II and III secretion system protein family protein [Frateuria sp. Soil773]